jgi:hypothetical protein
MATSVNASEPLRETPTASRLRTVTGSRWPRKCACGCGLNIPRDPEVRYVVDFGAPKPYPAYLREHSPDYGTYRGSPRSKSEATAIPAFRPASELIREPPRTPLAPRPAATVGHEDADATASPEAGRAWASGQLVFNAGQFESARSGFADYARDGECAKELRARVNRTILEDLEARVLALRQLHAKLRDQDAGESFGDVVGRSYPKSEML